MGDNTALNSTTKHFHVRRTLLRSIVKKKPAKQSKAKNSPLRNNPVAADAVQGLAAALEHEEIAHRAWKIWKSEGCPEGRDKIHWFKAQQMLRNEKPS